MAKDYAADIIKSAKSQVGVKEGKNPNGSNNNRQKYSKEVPGLEWSDGQPWCATFVVWNALKVGCPSLYPKTASCDVGGNWFKARKEWSEYPGIGAQVFYGTPRDLNHTGIVYDYDDHYIYTIEGNTNNSGSREGDGVYLKKRLRRGANVIGYGYPAFPLGIKNADPSRKHLNPKPPTVKPPVASKYDRPDNAKTAKPTQFNQSFYHSEPYCANNSYKGLNAAKAKGFKAIDLDFVVSKDAAAVNTHWLSPGMESFTLNNKVLSKSSKFSNYTLADIKKMKCKAHGHRIHSANQMFKAAKARGLKIEIEAKDATGFNYGEGGYRLFKKLKRNADAAYGRDVTKSQDVVVKTLSTLPGAKKRLMAAHRAGFKTVLLPRGTKKVSRTWWPYVDYVRGDVIWVD